MDETLFYVFGIALVLSALAVSVLGLRVEGFPPSRLALAGVIAYFAALVGATTTFAVLNARDEQHKREAEQAEAAATTPSGGAATTAPTTTETTTTGAAPAGKATTVKLSADPSAIAYQQKQLSAKPGAVTIAFDNPSAVTHDVCLEGAGAADLGCSDQIAQANASLSADLKPGSYTFYCSVDNHRQAGMEGTLTVK
jgi:plastocyanin